VQAGNIASFPPEHGLLWLGRAPRDQEQKKSGAHLDLTRKR
jgi:hypothetical protein